MSTPLIRFDWAMKTILRDKANFDVLAGFLSSLLNEPIIVEELLESEGNAEEASDKFNRVDLLVRDSQGRRIIIEIQNQREVDYLERLLYGTSRVIVDNLSLGEHYRQVVKVISVSILYFNLGVGDDYVYYGTTEFRGLHTGHPLTVRQRVESPGKLVGYQPKHVFPEYYLINVERFQDVIQSSLDEWIYLLKHSAVPTPYQAPGLAQAEQKLAMLRMTPEERQRYERYVTNLVIEQDVMETAHHEGWEKGMTEGRQKGLVEGRLEERHDTVLRLRSAGWTAEQISGLLGWEIEEVQRWLGERGE